MLPIMHDMLQDEERREANHQLYLERRVLRENSNPFSLPDIRFTELFRLNEPAVEALINMLNEHLIEPKNNAGISTGQKIFTALRFYATGSYQRCVGEEYQIALCQSMVHK